MDRRLRIVRSRSRELPDSGEGEPCVNGVIGVADGVGIWSISRLPIRLPMLLVRPGLNVPDGLDTEGVRTIVELPGLGVAGTLGEGVGAEGANRWKVVGVRTLDRIGGVGETCVADPDGFGWLGLLIEGCLWMTDSLRDGAANDRLGVEGTDGAGRLMLGDGLRVGVRVTVELLRVPSELLRLICILGCEPTLMRGLTDRLGAIEGMDRCGIERGADWIDRLGAGRDIDGADRLGVDRLAWPPLLREPRSLRWASADGASSRAAATTTAPAIIKDLDFFFVENIVDLLSPAAVLLFRQPGTPLPASPPAPYTPCEITMAASPRYTGPAIKPIEKRA